MVDNIEGTTSSCIPDMYIIVSWSDTALEDEIVFGQNVVDDMHYAYFE